MINGDINWSARADATSGPVTPGTLCVLNGSGNYVVATDANVAASATKRAHGVFLDVLGASVDSVRVQMSGVVDASITGLADISATPGAQVQYVRRSSTGHFERAAFDVTNSTDTSEWVGLADLKGNVLMVPQLPFNASVARHLDGKVSILDWGGVADSEFTFGLKAGSGATLVGTNNSLPLQRAYDAGCATGKPFTLRIPPGIYGFCPPDNSTYADCDITALARANGRTLQPVAIECDRGDRMGNGYTRAYFVFPTYLGGAFGGITTRVNCLDARLVPSGSSMRGITITQPQVQLYAQWHPGMGIDFNAGVVPSNNSLARGCTNVIYRTTAAGYTAGPSASDEPNWPREFDAYLRDEVWVVGQKIVIWNIVDSLNPTGKPWVYVCTARSGKGRSPSFFANMPAEGAAEKWTAGVHYDVTQGHQGVPVRPVSAWNGSWFIYYTGTGTSNTEPNWAAAPNKGDLTPVLDGVQFINGGPLWPREAGQSLTINQEDAGGSTTWQLDSTAGTFTDPNTNGSGGAITYQILPSVAGLAISTIWQLEDCHFEYIQGDGVRHWSQVGTVGDFSEYNNCIFFVCANNGLWLQGGDANSMILKNCQFIGNGNCGLRDTSFLGNIIIGGQGVSEDANHTGRYTIRFDQSQAAGAMHSFYIENGSAPARITPADMKLFNRLGAWSFYPDPGIADAKDFNTSISPLTFISGPKGRAWPAKTALHVDDVIFPNTQTGHQWKVTGVTTDGVTLTGTSEPGGLSGTTIGGTVNEVTGTGTTTYTNIGTQLNSVVVGSTTDPTVALALGFSDTPTPSGNLIPANYITYQAVTVNGERQICLTKGGAGGAFPIQSFSLTTGSTAFYAPIWLGFSIDIRRIWQDSAAPTAGAWAAGERVLNNGRLTSQEVVDYWYCSAGGSPGTWIPIAPEVGAVFTQPMADANQSFATSRRCIQFTGANTATRTATISGMAVGVYAFDNKCTGAFAVKISPAAGDLSTNGIANGKTAMAYYDGTNFRRTSADATP